MLFVKQKENLTRVKWSLRALLHAHPFNTVIANKIKNLTYVPHQAKVWYKETLRCSVQMLLQELVSEGEKKSKNFNSSVSVS